MNRDRRSPSSLVKGIKRLLALKAKGKAKAAGYFARLEDNLVPGVQAHHFECNLQAAGHELEAKFLAVHSSSALAVNTFAIFKDRPQDLFILGKKGCDSLQFEKRLPTGLRGIPPHLDVFIRRGDEAIAIESKFLEYFTPKEARYSRSYIRARLPQAEDCWWIVLEQSKRAGKRNLDVAQLVKHYLGLSRLLTHGDKENGWKPAKATLLYLFWEPENTPDIEVCRQHRLEVEQLADRVRLSAVEFRSASYPQLWKRWAGISSLELHANHLMGRYSVSIW